MSSLTNGHSTVTGPGLLPNTIDRIAYDTPDRPWVSIPNGRSPDTGYRDVSFRTFANAINYMAWFLEQELGTSTSFETIAYIGKPDLRHHCLAMAAAKTGYKVLFSSHMNSLTAHLHLIRKCSTKYFLSSEGVEVSDILSAEPLKNIIVPSLDELLEATNVQEYPFTKSYSEAVRDPFLILHTSGTTGLPKPIVMTQGSVAASGQHLALERQEGDDQKYLRREVLKGRFLIGFAPFHTLSMVSLFGASVYGQMVFVFGLRDEMMDLEAEMSAIEHANLVGFYTPPTFLERAVKSEKNLAIFRKLKCIIYGEGPLPESTAQKILDSCPDTFLASSWGSTEIGPSIQYLLDREDWAYVGLDSEHMGIDWRPVKGDDAKTPDLYEPVLINKAELFKYQPVFNLYPDLKEWEIGDLWSKHPTKRDAWRYYGRTDDLLVFSHGLKLHPKQIEDEMNSHKFVQSALMYGHGRAQPVLLIELNDDAIGLCEKGEAAAARVREDIWTMVEQLNKTTQAIAQISPTHIIILVRKDQRFQRTAKGTIARRGTFREFEAQIEQIYEQFGDNQVNLMSRIAK